MKKENLINQVITVQQKPTIFAEFAFLAVTLAVDPSCWKNLLKTFVKCQEIFIRVYRPAGLPPYRLDDYQANNYRRGLEDDKKKEFRDKYDKMKPGQLEKEGRDIMKNAQNPIIV